MCLYWTKGLFHIKALSSWAKEKVLSQERISRVRVTPQQAGEDSQAAPRRGCECRTEVVLGKRSRHTAWRTVPHRSPCAKVPDAAYILVGSQTLLVLGAPSSGDSFPGPTVGSPEPAERMLKPAALNSEPL